MADITYRPERVLPTIRQQLRAFIGMSAWEVLSKEWVDWATDPSQQHADPTFDWFPENIGSYWDRHVQIDVVALNWQEKRLLLGECKWQPDPISRKVVKALVEIKRVKLLTTFDDAENWRVAFACFARGGFTDAARQYAEQQRVELVDLERLDRDLGTIR